MLYGEKLKEIRLYEDMKQTELCEKLGITNAAYSEFEREKTIIPLKYLIAIANIFNVSIDYIFSFNSEKSYTNMKSVIDKKIISKRLKEFRKENNLTLAKLASILNVSISIISEYEHEKYLISTNFLYTICKKYNISADYLLGRIDNPKYLKSKN